MTDHTRDGKFASAAGCMDGRALPAVQRFAKEELNADNVDIVAAEPGYVRARRVSAALLARLFISQHHHGSDNLIVYGHQECAGNPVDDDTHKSQTLATARRLRRSITDMIIHPVFVERTQIAEEDVNGWVARRIPEEPNKVRGRKKR